MYPLDLYSSFLEEEEAKDTNKGEEEEEDRKKRRGRKEEANVNPFINNIYSSSLPVHPS